MLDCGNAVVLKALEKSGVKVPELKAKVRAALLGCQGWPAAPGMKNPRPAAVSWPVQAEAAAKRCAEPAAAAQPATPPEAQVAQLVEQYKRHVAQNKPPPSPVAGGGWQQQQQREPPVGQAWLVSA